jgi:tRNA/rRNA methyltransferase
MVNPSHPGNVGSAARAMKTMGLAHLALVAPRIPDVTAHPDAIALASGATDVLTAARVVDSLGDALADVQFALAFTSRRRDLSHGMAPLREAAAQAMAMLAAPEARVALVFGTEALGLSNEDVDRCQMIAMIPANPHYMSLNVSQAIQLAAYEIMMAANAFQIPANADRPAARVGEVEGFLQHLESAAVDSGFLDPNSPKRFMTRMRRLFTRARLEPEEVAILRGLLTSFQKARHD